MTIFGLPWPLALMLAVAVLYPVVARLLSNYAHPKRMRIEQLGNALLSDSKLTAFQRKFVQLSLDLNGKSWPMAAIALILPLMLLTLLLVPSVRKERPEDKEIHALLSDKRFAEIQAVEIGCLFAANPIAGIVVALEAAILVATGAAFLIGTRGLERTFVRIGEALDSVLSNLFGRNGGKTSSA